MIAVFVMVVILEFFISQSYCHRNSPQKKHVIIIIADDLGWNDVGFHGSDQIPTPNIDALAYSGLILNQHYSSPICTPSRAALMTGKHPIHTVPYSFTKLITPVLVRCGWMGDLPITDLVAVSWTWIYGVAVVTRSLGGFLLGMQSGVITGSQPWGLSLEEKILPQYFKELDYKTYLIGKWHLGFFSQNYTPTFRGFDYHFGYWTGHEDYFTRMAQETEDSMGYDLRRQMEVDKRNFGKYMSELLCEESVAVISNHSSEEPMLLVVSHIAPHAGNSFDPLQAPKESTYHFIEDEHRRIFAGMVGGLDHTIGKIMQTLANKEMLEDSIILLVSDNGGATAGIDRSAGSNWPLRGVKYTLFEGGIRTPAILWTPTLISPGRVFSQMIHIQDWLPTLYSAVGGDPNSIPDTVDGLNIWDSLMGGLVSPRNEVLHNIVVSPRAFAALRMGDFKIVMGSALSGWGDYWYGPSGRSTPDHPLPPYNLTLIRSSDTAKALNLIDLRLPSDENMISIRNTSTVHCVPPLFDYTITEPFGSSKRFCNSTGNICLFNIKDDPCETNDVSNSEPQVLATMQRRLLEYYATAVPSRRQCEDPRGNPKNWDYTWTNWFDQLPLSEQVIYPCPVYSDDELIEDDIDHNNGVTQRTDYSLHDILEFKQPYVVKSS